MRSYRFLIEYPSDFALAVQKGLIPVDCNTSQDMTVDGSEKPDGNASLDKTGNKKKEPEIDFASFIEFMEDFDIDDAEVSRRFQYGDLRLGRLNFWAKFVLGEFTFSKAYGNYDAYISRFYGPLLFAFGVLSIIISSIQLGFASQAGLGTVHNGWQPLYRVGDGLCVAILLVTCLIAVSLPALFVFMGLRETIFVLKHLAKRRKGGKPRSDDEDVVGGGSSATGTSSPSQKDSLRLRTLKPSGSHQ